MFGIKGKALFVYVVLSFVLNVKGKAQAFRERIILNCAMGYRTEHVDEGRNQNWRALGNEKTLFMSDNNDSRFIKFRQRVDIAIRDVLEKYPLNNVNHLMRFIDAYNEKTKHKHQTLDSLESFFNEYNVPLNEIEDPASLLIKIDELLTQYAPIEGDMMYMVTAYVNPPEIPESLKKPIKTPKIDDKKEEEFEFNLHKDEFQRHVAGVININIHGEPGIILVDPGYINGTEIVYPYFAVVMENRNSKYNGVSQYGVPTKELDLSLTSRFAVLSDKSTKQQVLYARKQAFCHFKTKNIKANLLSRNYGIMTFEPNRSPRGYLTFAVNPNTEKSFWMGPIHEDTKKFLGTRFKFDDYLYNDQRLHNSLVAYMDTEMRYADDYLPLRKGDGTLISKLRKLKETIFDNPTLVQQLHELTEKLTTKKHTTAIDKKSKLSNADKRRLMETDNKPGFKMFEYGEVGELSHEDIMRLFKYGQEHSLADIMKLIECTKQRGLDSPAVIALIMYAEQTEDSGADMKMLEYAKKRGLSHAYFTTLFECAK